MSVRDGPITPVRGRSPTVEPMPDDPFTSCTRRQALRLLAGGGALVAAGGALAACVKGSANTGDSSTTLDVTRFGAVGDGRTDDTAAIQRALDSLASSQTLQFPGGKVFCHDDVLTVDTAGVRIVGPGELRATNEERSAFKVQAAGVTVDGLTLGVATTTRRWSTPDQHKLFVGPVSGVTVQDVRITGSAAAGLFALGASGFRFARVQVSDTRADGIHMTFGAHDGMVDHPVVARSGDDGVAVVSYLQDGAVCHDITVVAPTVTGTTWGRGLSVVGGHDITYTDVVVDRSSAAGIYLACEGDPSNTCDTRRVSVTDGTVTGANTDADVDHGAVLVYSGRAGGTVDTVEVSGLTVSGTRSGASRQIGVVTNGGADGVSGVLFRDLHLGGGPPPYQGNAPLGAVRLDGVTADGRTVISP